MNQDRLAGKASSWCAVPLCRTAFCLGFGRFCWKPTGTPSHFGGPAVLRLTLLRVEAFNRFATFPGQLLDHKTLLLFGCL